MHLTRRSWFGLAAGFLATPLTRLISKPEFQWRAVTGTITFSGERLKKYDLTYEKLQQAFDDCLKADNARIYAEGRGRGLQHLD